ncbi:hypothetical protein Trydic_g14676 [Trypoxylus dichotomus]
MAVLFSARLLSIQEAGNHQYCRRVPGGSITALHSAKVDRSSVYFCSTLELREPLHLGGLDIASTSTSNSTIIHINIGDPVLAEVDAARKRQSTPRANLDPMVCKFLRNQQSDYNETRAYYMKRRKRLSVAPSSLKWRQTPFTLAYRLTGRKLHYGTAPSREVISGNIV